MVNNATYTFLPWVRRGLAGSLKSANDIYPLPPRRVSLPVKLTVETDATAGASKIAEPEGLQLYGPGDITGIDTRVISRVEPKPGTANFKPNDLPLIEFSEPDFPWLFTPSGPDSQQRLLPWLYLVCVRKGPGVEIQPRRDGLPVLEINPANDPDGELRSTGPGGELPDLSEAWAWAHVQVAGRLSSAEAIANVEPDRLCARLLCPRNLKPLTRYYACLVPVFQEGALAALGETLASSEELASETLSLAWETSSADAGKEIVRLPLYYHWEFGTGFEGDFESLARLLETKSKDELDDRIGTREVDVQNPGFKVPQEIYFVRSPRSDTTVPDEDGIDLPIPVRLEPVFKTLPIEGALRIPGTVAAAQPTELENSIESLLRKTEDDEGQPVVGPPVYGRWHAAEPALPSQGEGAAWLHELNLTIRHRIAAGVGVSVVRDQQEQLMASAWDQMGEIRRVNQLLRQAQLARQVSRRISERYLLFPKRCDDPEKGRDALIQLTAPLHRRITLEKQQPNGPPLKITIKGDLTNSAIPPAAVSPAFRKIIRPGGPVMRRFTSESDLEVTSSSVNLTQEFHSGRFSAAFSNQAPPNGTITLNSLELPEDDLLPSDKRPQPSTPDLEAIHDALCKKLNPEKTICRRTHGRLSSAVKRLLWPGDSSDCSLEPILAAPNFPRPMYLELKARSQEWLLPGLEHIPTNSITLVETNPKFVESYMAGLNHEMSAELLWREFPTDQRGTYFRKFWDTRGSSISNLEDDINPMHLWQRELGAHLKQGNDASRLVLLIRGELLRLLPNTIVYATRAVFEKKSPTWPGRNPKHKNKARRPIITNPGNDSHEEVLFDEEGNGYRPKEWRKRELYPVFRGTLEPDITFLGFDLTSENAIGAVDPTTGESGAGWFFVLQGQPTEPRFGLDETLDFSNVGRPSDELIAANQGDSDNQIEPWSDITWGDLIQNTSNNSNSNKDNLDQLSYIRIRAENDALNENDGLDIGGFRWGWNSAHMAYITFNLPIRIAIHADDMIPRL